MKKIKGRYWCLLVLTLVLIFAGVGDHFSLFSEKRLGDKSEALQKAYKKGYPKPKKGWQKEGGYWYLYDKEGKLLTGWQKDKNKWYYLKKTGEKGIKGRMLTGWQTLDHKKYFLGGKEDGAMKTGWASCEGRYYHFNIDGSLMDKATDSEIANLALSKQGALYAWGEEGPDVFDCSGLVDWAYRQAGGHPAHRYGTKEMRENFASYDVGDHDMKAGDLIICCGGNHVVIYIGDGLVVGASGGSREVHGDNPAINVHVEDYKQVYKENTIMVLRIPIDKYL